MKRILAMLISVVLLCSVLATVAMAASSVSSNEYVVSGSKTFSVTTSFEPKYITFDFSDSSGAVAGFVTVEKPDGTSYQNFVSYSGNGTTRKRVYNADAGTYTFRFSNSGTITVKVTLSN